jgi:hypothetical protein
MIQISMNSHYREALPQLHEVLKFNLEEIHAVDLYYNDGDPRVRESFFKLVIPRGRDRSSIAVVYIQEGTFWVSFGELTETESKTIRHWIKNI